MVASTESYRGQQFQIALAKSALTIGTISGTTGLLFGSAVGIIRSSHPVITAIASGIHWFALGTTYWGTRAVILNTWANEELSPRRRTYASGLAGGLSGGAVAALIRGRANIFPGIIAYSLLGSAGQALYNKLDASYIASQYTNSDSPPTSFLQTLASKKWIPMKSLSDAEYEHMLKEKLLKVEAEIAVLDDDISQLRAADKHSVPTDPKTSQA